MMARRLPIDGFRNMRYEASSCSLQAGDLDWGAADIIDPINISP
jgi:hypothetical protein